MATSPRRLRWVLGATALVAVAVAIGLASRGSDRALPTAPPPGDVPRPAVETPAPPPRPPAPSPPSPPNSAPPPAPGAPELPPSASPTPPEEDLAIPPEAPQTVEWKLGKTELILDSLGKRVQRLEKEIQEAEARGDRETVKRQRILLDRSRQRMAELERDAAAMKADGGAR